MVKYSPQKPISAGKFMTAAFQAQSHLKSMQLAKNSPMLWQFVNLWIPVWISEFPVWFCL